MTRKVIVDADPGIDDAVALLMALFDPRLEVLAVTAAAGNVSAEQATRNVQAIIEQLDPPRWPRVGAAVEPDEGAAVDATHLFGRDGLGDVNFPVVELHQKHTSDKVISDLVRMHPGELTIVCLGPLTNVARAFQRDPSLVSLVGQLVIMGGAVNGVGNVTATAEFNIYCDAKAARQVFRARVTKTLVPLDVTNQVLFDYGFVDQLPDETQLKGRFLRRILPHCYRAYRQHLGFEGIHLHDAVALVALLQPELFETESLYGDVETSGDLTRGMTVFDRRQPPREQANMEVAMTVDVAAATDAILRGVR